MAVVLRRIACRLEAQKNQADQNVKAQTDAASAVASRTGGSGPCEIEEGGPMPRVVDIGPAAGLTGGDAATSSKNGIVRVLLGTRAAAEHSPTCEGGSAANHCGAPCA